jgi:hypothetical protein
MSTAKVWAIMLLALAAYWTWIFYLVKDTTWPVN